MDDEDPVDIVEDDPIDSPDEAAADEDDNSSIDGGAELVEEDSGDDDPEEDPDDAIDEELGSAEEEEAVSSAEEGEEEEEEEEEEEVEEGEEGEEEEVEEMEEEVEGVEVEVEEIEGEEGAEGGDPAEEDSEEDSDYEEDSEEEDSEDSSEGEEEEDEGDPMDEGADTSCLPPPSKKRRLSHQLSLSLYGLSLSSPADDDPGHDKRYDEPDGCEMEIDEDLPEIYIPNVASGAYDLWVDSLPPNVLFQARISASPSTRLAFPNSKLDQMVRLYYPDYRSFGHFVEAGVVPKLGLETSRNIKSLKLFAKKGDNVLCKTEIKPCDGEEFDKIMADLKKNGLWRMSDGGMKLAGTVKLLVKLNWEDRQF